MTDPLPRLSAALADRYRILRELGQGGMATVYLAEDLKHDRKVALKVLKPELAAVIGAERFVVEIKTTAALQHPHILPLFDSGETNGFLYYVMPFIDGETLRAKLDRETQLGIDEAVSITTAVADALDYAHRHGVIHRDIKPENILLHDGRPMVADFGIALALSAAAGGRMTETGMSLGTPHYMSPEQATAEKEITARSDVYSLGSVLYEMLTGNPPHTGASAQQIIMKIVTQDAAPVTELRKAVPPNVAGAVAQSLQKLPADRFESAKAFADALQSSVWRSTATLGAAASAPPSKGIDALPGGRLTLGLVAALLVMTALAGWGLFNRPALPVVRMAMGLPRAAGAGLRRHQSDAAPRRDHPRRLDHHLCRYRTDRRRAPRWRAGLPCRTVCSGRGVTVVDQATRRTRGSAPHRHRERLGPHRLPGRTAHRVHRLHREPRGHPRGSARRRSADHRRE